MPSYCEIVVKLCSDIQTADTRKDPLPWGDLRKRLISSKGPTSIAIVLTIHKSI